MLFRGDSHGAGHIQGWEQIQIRGQKAVSTQLMQPAFPTGIQNNAKYFEKKKISISVLPKSSEGTEDWKSAGY